MAYDYRTKHGYNMFDMSSMLQKSIRRGDWTHAGFAACELYYSFYNYLWKRLLVISAEDCNDMLTQEIIALRIADDEVNDKKRRNGEICDHIFISKAIMLLVKAQKNRDACYFACNFLTSKNPIDVNKVEHVDISTCNLGVEGIPDWVFDKHTLKGKRSGQTSLDFIKSEQECLEPHQMGFFDDGDWYQWSQIYNISDADRKKWPKFAEGKTRYE